MFVPKGDVFPLIKKCSQTDRRYYYLVAKANCSGFNFCLYLDPGYPAHYRYALVTKKNIGGITITSTITTISTTTSTLNTATSMTISNEHGNENGEAFCFSMSLTPPSHPSKARFFQSKIRKILFRTFLVIAAHWLIQRSRGPWVSCFHPKWFCHLIIKWDSNSQILRCVRGA